MEAESPDFVASDMHFQIVEIIDAELARRHITRRQLAEMAGISWAHLCRIMRPSGTRVPTMRTMGALLAALGLRVTVEALVLEGAAE